jgi:hypothetical protein
LTRFQVERGSSDGSLHTAVLLQKVIPSEYAFVIHTADPISGDRSKIFGEVVAGLGEVLVGSYPGRAFSFTYNEDGSTVSPSFLRSCTVFAYTKIF